MLLSYQNDNDKPLGITLSKQPGTGTQESSQPGKGTRESPQITHTMLFSNDDPLLQETGPQGCVHLRADNLWQSWFVMCELCHMCGSRILPGGGEVGGWLRDRLVEPRGSVEIGFPYCASIDDSFYSVRCCFIDVARYQQQIEVLQMCRYIVDVTGPQGRTNQYLYACPSYVYICTRRRYVCLHVHVCPERVIQSGWQFSFIL